MRGDQVTYVQAHVSPPQNSDHLQKPVLQSIQITCQYQGNHLITCKLFGYTYLTQISSPNEMPSFAVLKHLKFPYNILSFHVSVHNWILCRYTLYMVLCVYFQWLTSQLAVLLDSKEFVHIIHVRSATLLQVSIGIINRT